MKWLTDNLGLIVTLLSVAASVATSLGWLKSGKVLKAVIEGVEGADNKAVKQSIKSHAQVAGVEAVLHGIVAKVTKKAA